MQRHGSCWTGMRWKTMASDPTGMGDLRPRKRSVTLRGHRTSVSLEDPFWEGLVAIAEARGLSVNAMVAEIDETRGISAGLASAIRVFVLRQSQGVRG